MDSTTKWLVRIASGIIILTGLILAIIIPVIALKINGQIAIVQNSLKEAIEILSQKLIS
tara:strand:- start:499 stop:675 length:177 start_codon:yes stop_codon:yes gene_type:complete